MENEAKTDENTILIKKYPNRRLYNTQTSAYIVLDDVVTLVKTSKPFVIVDTKTGEDITRSILNQIIFERETSANGFHFPLEVQKKLIGMYDDTYSQFLPTYLKESLEIFSAERDKIAGTMGDVLQQNTKAMLEFSQNMARQNMELFKQSWQMFNVNTSEDEKTEKRTSNSDKSDEKALNEGLDDIQKQINALQQKLEELK